MRKRFNLTWRIMVALILVLSLVPALITATGTVAAATGPSVYLDPLPAYVSSAMLPGLTFSGTSLATGPRTIKDVLVQIKFKDSVTSTWLYWDGAADAWSTIADSYNYAETITTPGAWGTQTDWEWDGSGPDIFPVAANLSDGMTYTVTVWAMDDNMDKGASVSRTFIYDKTLPSGSAILVIGDANSGTGWVATSITTISGSARDTAPGAVGQVWVEIDDNTAGHGWDGVTWNGAVGQWILASGTTSWSVTTSTTTPLPNWISGHSYTVTIYVFDKAGNQETSAPTQNFTYLKVPATGLDIYMDILPAYMQGVDFVNVSGVAKSSGSTNDILNVSIKIYNNAAQYWDENFPCDWKIGDPQPWNLAYPLDGVAFDSPTEAWYYDDTACWPIIHDGYTYTITARTYQTSTTKKESASQNVVIDNTSPIDTVITSMGITTYLGTTVFQGTSYEDLVQGTANDNTAGIAPGKLAKVSVTIQDSTDGVAWDGIAWGAGADLRTVAKDGSFNSNAEGWKITDATTPSLPTWKHDHHYVITAWATDAAGNVEAPNAIINFWYVKDLSGTAPVPTPTPTEAPTPTPAPALTCAVTNPTNNANLSALVSINGTSADDVAVLGLKVRICNSSSGLCWNGSAWKANLSLADAPAATASDGTFNSISEPWFYTTLPTWGTGSTYQVQAQATDATTTPANSSVVAFGFGVPSTPVSPSPADSSTGVSVDANLDWSDCSNTTYYQVYFGTSSNPSTLNGSPSASSLALPTLSHNTTYYWKVVARNDCGGFTSSSIWHFTTECAALGTPVSPSPADSSTGVSVDTALDWSDCANATYYQVYFGTGSNPSTLNGSPTYSDLSLSTLNYSTTYYWKVVARDSCGNFVNSSIWHFTTECGTPGTPASPSPANTSSPRVPLNTSGLQWSNCLNTLYYDVYFGTSSTPSLLNSYITSSCPIPTLTANTTYYWKVVARNSCGNFTNSSTWYFTTECAMPHAPTDSAYNGSSCASINTTLRFWGTMYGDADYYQFYLSNNSSTLKLVGSINQSQFWNGEGCDVSNLSYNTTYYWKVVANTSCGVNNSSPIWRFTTERFLAKPLTPSPVNGSTGVSVNVTLDWEDCANASSYYVYYDTSLNPYNGVVVSTNNSSCQLTSLPYGATFYWLVVSENNCSTNYSDIWRFTTVDGPKVVNIGGANASWNLNSSGVVQQAVNLASADNKITVNIPARTTALNRYGEPLDEIAMITTNVSPAPDDGRFVVAAFDFGPDGATFHPGITITLKYDPAMIPSGENEADLVIAFYNEITDKWEYINNGVVDPSANTITFTVGHFTIFTIQTPASSGSGIWVIVAIIAAAVVVLGLLAVLFYSRYRRTHVSLYYEDDEEGYNTYGGEDTSQTRPSSKDNW